MAEKTQYCTFFLEDLHFGVPVKHVQEILRYMEMTPVPTAAAEIEGLLNLRGQILTCIDLRQRLKLEARPEDLRPMHLIVRDGNESISLLVDRIGDVVDLEDEQVEEVPETVQEEIRCLLEAVYKMESHFMLILDVPTVVSVKAQA